MPPHTAGGIYELDGSATSMPTGKVRMTSDDHTFES
jgi:hypothetical protein